MALFSFGMAHAASFSYTPSNGATDTWAAPSIGWDATPVSDLDTSLFFGPATTYTDGVAITNTNTNDIGAFTLNALTLQGTGPLTLGFPISVTITGGSLNFVNSSGAVAPVINLNAANGGSPVSYTINSAITLGNTTTITGNGNATFAIGGAISGSGGLIKSGASVLTLSGASSYTGNTAINGGILKIGAANNLGDAAQPTNTISFNGGTLNSTGGTYDLGANRAITLNGAGTIQTDAGALTISGAVNNGANLLTVTGGGNTTISGNIGSGSGGITKTGAGTLTLSGAGSSYTGTTTLTAGTLVAGTANALGAAAAPLSLAGGTLNLASDSSILAHPTTITGGMTIQSNKATASSPGITHQLGTLSINASNLTTTSTNTTGGSPVVAFSSTTLTGAPTFTPNSAALSLGAVTGPGTATNIILGGSYTGVSSSIGAITNIGSGIVTKNSTATWTFNGTSTYTAGTTISAGGNTIVGADNAFGTGLVQITSAAAILKGDGTMRTLRNDITTTNISGVTFGGNLTFSGVGTPSIFTYGPTGTGNIVVSNTAGPTVFDNATFLISSGTGDRNANIRGDGSLFMTTISTNSGNTGNQQFRYTGSGTLTLSAANSGSYKAFGATISTFTVATGTTAGVNEGNSTLKISGDYTIGSVGRTRLLINGGDGTAAATRGTLSLVDGTKNTLTINDSTASPTNALLTMGAAANYSLLALEMGGGGSDKITLGTGRLVTNAGGVKVRLTGIGNLVGGDNIIVQAANAPSLGGAFSLDTTFGGGTGTDGNFGGYTTVGFATVGTNVVAQLGGLTATPATAYWTGNQGSGGNATWNTFNGGIANNTNWATDVGGTNSKQVPGAITNVIFSKTGGSANSGTTLGTNTAVNSVTFNDQATSAVTIGGSTLTLAAGSDGGNPAGNGLNVQSGSGAHTINSNVALGVSQTWTNSSASDLTVNGVVSGSGKALTKAGTGALVLGGNNTYDGGLIINDGAVRVANAGALNSSTPNSVTFGASAPSTAKLQLNGNNVTISSLATNATPGSPVVENANASPATLTISQSANTTYAGTLANGTGGGALSVTKTGAGSLTLSGNNSHTGTTSVNGGKLFVNGDSSAATGPVSVGSAVLGGTGTIGGAVSVSGTGTITAADIGSTGTLNLAGGLNIASGGIAYFDINDNSTFDSIHITGNLSLASGSIFKMPASLTTTTSYDLFTYTGAGPSDLSGINFQSFGGGSLPGTYAFSIVGANTIRLTISGATTAIPTINITSPAGGTRVMSGTSVNVTGNFGNTGVADLHGTLGDNSGQLAVSNFTPSGSTTVAPSGSQGYTATIANTGVTLGSRNYSIKVTDPDASPISTSATSTLDVLGNRTVNASTVAYGNVHVNAVASGSTSITSSQADDQYTRVTVANGSNGSGFAVTGGNTATVFNGTNSDSRTLAGTFTSVGSQSGSVTLTTTGEGLTGEAPINVNAGYNATAFSGKAAWTSNASSSWVTQGNWGDTNVANLGGAGAPGLDGSASIGDTATFGDVIGAGPATTVSLNGVSPSLSAITFNSASTSYTIATGSSGSISLQDAASAVSVTGNHAISAVLTGSGGMSKTGAGTLTLSGANTYAGATAIANGIVQLTSGNDRLPNTTAVTLGAGGNSSKLVLGSGVVASNQTLTGLLISGSQGAANRVVGGASTISTLTVGVASGTNTFGGTIGGGGANENNLALTKTGAGALILSNSPTHTGTNTISQGVLQTPTGADLSGFVIFGGGSVANAGIWQTNGTITKTLSTASASGNLNWVSFNGFAASGGTLNLALNGGSQLTWAANGLMGTGGATMVFGSASADSQVILPNDLNLATGDDFQRPIFVAQGLGGDSAKLSGVISAGAGTSGISKQGAGMLVLSGNNTYTGTTNVTAGTVKIENVNALGYGGVLNVPTVAGSIAPGMTVISSGATVDLNGQSGVTPGLGIREAFSVTGTGVGGLGALVNTNTGATATIDPGLTSLGIANQGAGYTTASVTITGGGFTGTTHATATAVVGTLAPNIGKIISITLTSYGDGIYTSAPTVTLTGDGTGAVGSGVVSSINMAGAGSIGGAGNIVVNAPVTGANPMTKVGAGNVTLTGVNTYSGATTVNGGKLILATASSGALASTSAVTISAGSLQLDVANQINDVAPMTLAGGTFNLNGLSETVGTLALTLDSVIDLGNVASILNFANSSGVAWTSGKTLAIWNWTEGSDHIYFGSDGTSLNFGQVAQVSFYAGSGTGFLGGASLLGTGELVVAVPEPREYAVAIIGLMAAIVFLRRRRSRAGA